MNDSRLQILQMIDDGKISAVEGVPSSNS
jgi:hypothetical protein